jgi:hypothetical protein
MPYACLVVVSFHDGSLAEGGIDIPYFSNYETARFLEEKFQKYFWTIKHTHTQSWRFYEAFSKIKCLILCKIWYPLQI